MKRRLILKGIIKCKDEYLIVQRSEDDNLSPGAWELPGGKIENVGLILEALRDELTKDLGIIIDTDSAKLVHFYETIKEKKEKYHQIELDFLIEMDNKNIGIKLDKNHNDYKWVKKDSKLLNNFVKEKIKDI